MKDFCIIILILQVQNHFQSLKTLAFPVLFALADFIGSTNESCRIMVFQMHATVQDPVCNPNSFSLPLQTLC